jgi:hypothetical protein
MLPTRTRSGFSGDVCGNPLRSRLKGLPGPKRTVHASPGECDLENNPTQAHGTTVHNTFVLLPAGTVYRGTRKHD